MNPTPTISEAARQLAKRIDQEYAGYRIRGEQLPDTYGLVFAAMSALDSAHPAPKEWETPETDATLTKWPIDDAVNVQAAWRAKVRRFARSLELRLSEAKREITQLKNNDTNLTDMLNDLRSQLKTANELLGEAKDWLPTKQEGDREHRQHAQSLIERIATHLNQQSK